MPAGQRQVAVAAIRKKRQGIPLSTEDEEALRVYFAQYKDRRHSLYFESGEQKATLRALAEEAGYANFNAWIVEQVKLATSGVLVDSEVLAMMRARIDEMEKREELAHARADEARRQRDEERAKTDEAYERVMEYADAMRDMIKLLHSKGITIEFPELT